MEEEYYKITDLNERCNFINNYRSKIVRFYKEDNRWYADVPQHTKAENLMVAGADKFLDEICFGNDKVQLTVSDLISPKPAFLLHRINHNGYGATYEILESHPESPALGSDVHGLKNRKLWLCNVVHTVLGEHPRYISILDT